MHFANKKYTYHEIYLSLNNMLKPRSFWEIVPWTPTGGLVPDTTR